MNGTDLPTSVSPTVTVWRSSEMRTTVLKAASTAFAW